MPFIQRLGLQGLLSFPPDMEPFTLQPLNVLIGPNGSGKTNVIEALELLRAAPMNLGKALQSGGGVEEWMWKGEEGSRARITLKMKGGLLAKGPFLYMLEISDHVFGHGIHYEKIEEITSGADEGASRLIYRFDGGEPIISVKSSDSPNIRTERKLRKETFDRNESVLSQIKEPSIYPELSQISMQFREIKDVSRMGLRHALRPTPPAACGRSARRALARRPQPGAGDQRDSPSRPSRLRCSNEALPASIRTHVDSYPWRNRPAFPP